MRFKDAFPHQTKMNELECIFKQLHEQFPERNLQLPHSSEYVGDILKLASQKTGNSFFVAFVAEPFRGAVGVSFEGDY